MSSTNKTTNYELSQFIQTDKPTWLGDYNGDMLKIDGQMKDNADAISTVGGDITSLDGRLDTAEDNISANASAISGINDDITALQNKNTTQDAAITNIRNNLNAFENTFNLTQNTPIGNSIYDNRRTSIAGVATEMYIAQNTEGTVFKLYGQTNLANTSGSVTGSLALDPIPGMSGRYGVPIAQLLTAPAEAYSIAGAGIMIKFVNGTAKESGDMKLRVGTDGKIYTFTSSSSTYSIGTNTQINVTFQPCIYFNVNFGDNPSE